MGHKAESVAKKADAHSIVFEGKVEICDDYAGKEEILARIHEAFHAGVEAIAGAEARRAVETEGLRRCV